MKWHKFNDDEFMNQRVYWLDDWRAAFHPLHHGIQVFSEDETGFDPRC